MKSLSKVVLVAVGLLAGAGLSQAGGNVENGKMLFESPTLGGGTTGKTCATCHPGGKNLSSKLFSGSRDSLAEMVNTCIEKPLGGQAIDPAGSDMTDLVAYMETLVKGKKPSRKNVEGC